MGDIGHENRSIRNARKQAVLQCLRRVTDRAVPARELAEVCQIVTMNPETKRRRVRELVKELHEVDGVRICADDHSTQGGYWIARSDAEWRDYLEARRAKLRFGFVAARKAQAAAGDRTSGQATMFADFDVVRVCGR